MAQPKVAVVGLGSIGSMTLWQLAKKGVDVVGFEQFGVAHDRSAAGGESRMFRTAYMEGANYVPLLQRSRELWRDLESQSGLDLLNLNGGLMIGPEDNKQIENAIESTKQFNIDHDIYTAEQARKRFPQHRLNNHDIVLHDKEAGVIRPEMSVFAATKEGMKSGAVARTNTKIESIEETQTGVVLNTGTESLNFDSVVITTGPWAAELVPQLSADLMPRKIVMTWYPSNEPHHFTPEAFPIFARVGGHVRIFGVPALEGTLVKIGSVETFGDVPDPDRLLRDVKLDELDGINQAVENYFPNLHPEPARISVHMDNFTTDEHPFVGHVPNSERIVIMGGYSGHGFKLAPIMGEIGAELATVGSSKHNISHLNPDRFNNSRAE